MGRLLLGGARLFASQITITAPSRSPSIQSRLPLVSFLTRALLSSASFSILSSRFSTFQSPFDMTDLPAVEGLSLQSTSETSKFPNCFPSLNPVDIYREHIAEKLSAGSGIEAGKIYDRLMWTNTLDKGDLVLPVCVAWSGNTVKRG